MLRSENIRENNTQCESAAARNAAEQISPQDNGRQEEDDMPKIDTTNHKNEYEVDKRSKTDIKRIKPENKTIKKNLVSKLKNKRNKKAAET